MKEKKNGKRDQLQSKEDLHERAAAAGALGGALFCLLRRRLQGLAQQVHGRDSVSGVPRSGAANGKRVICGSHTRTDPTRTWEQQVADKGTKTFMKEVKGEQMQQVGKKRGQKRPWVARQNTDQEHTGSNGSTRAREALEYQDGEHRLCALDIIQLVGRARAAAHRSRLWSNVRGSARQSVGMPPTATEALATKVRREHSREHTRQSGYPNCAAPIRDSSRPCARLGASTPRASSPRSRRHTHRASHKTASKQAHQQRPKHTCQLPWVIQELAQMENPHLVRRHHGWQLGGAEEFGDLCMGSSMHTQG